MKDKIKQIFTNYAINLTDETLKNFETYYTELIEYNEKVNLTAITDYEDVYIKHFLDSILPINSIAKNSKVVDIGAGAGFPGLPIKIVRDDIDLTMVDSLNKRITFLNHICSKLKTISNNIHSRAEDFAKNNRSHFDVALARAVAPLNTLLEYLFPLVKVGGYIFAYKGSNLNEEIEDSKAAIKILGGQIENILEFNLPDEKGVRKILIIKKIKPTPSIYPRDKNQPKINPIK